MNKKNSGKPGAVHCFVRIAVGACRKAGQ